MGKVDYVFWDHANMAEEKPGIKFELIGKQLLNKKKEKWQKNQITKNLTTQHHQK